VASFFLIVELQSRLRGRGEDSEGLVRGGGEVV